MGFISAKKIVTQAEYYGRRRSDSEEIVAIEASCVGGRSLPLYEIF
jgi:hypothetical protein